MTTEEKIQSLTAKEIIMAMVEGLRNPETIIDMSTFGHRKDSICYGCAATNAIIKLGLFTREDLQFEECYNPGFSGARDNSVASFETSLDGLRKGNIQSYNYFANKNARIHPKPGLKIPHLDDDYTLEDLEPYVELANYQESWKQDKHLI